MLKWKFKNFIDQCRFEEANDVGMIKRCLAYIIDWYIGGILSSIPIFIIYQLTIKTEIVLATSLFILPKQYWLIAGILVLCIAFLYYVIVPAYLWKGQTLGKKLLKIQIVHDDYSEVTFKTLCKRQILYMFLIEGRVIMPSTTFHEMISLLLNYNVIFLCSSICYSITFISLFITVQLNSHKAIHDIFSHTKVMLVDSIIVKKGRKKNKRKQKERRLDL